MSKQLRLARRVLVPRDFWYQVRQNFKWGFCVFVFILIMVLITIPPYIWFDLDWLIYRPIAQSLYEFAIPIIFSLVVGAIARMFYLLWTRS